jgi:hypothetical protein
VSQCKLSDRQKDLLRLIARGLGQRQSPDQWWMRITHDNGMPVWQNVEDESLRLELQAQTELSDLVAFEKCGLIENPQAGTYYLVERVLMDLIENSFYEGTQSKGRKQR